MTWLRSPSTSLKSQKIFYTSRSYFLVVKWKTKRSAPQVTVADDAVKSSLHPSDAVFLAKVSRNLPATKLMSFVGLCYAYVSHPFFLKVHEILRLWWIAEVRGVAHLPMKNLSRKNSIRPGWQKLCRGTGGAPPKSLDSDENFKPEHTLFCRELRFVAIYVLYGDLWAKKSAFWGQKQCFLGKKCTITWYILHISLS